MFSSGYDYARWEHCAACGETVELYTTPGGRTIAMEPMCSRESPAVRHYLVCKPANPTPEEQKPQEQAVAPQQIAMYGVNDPNHQLIAVGWDDGVLVCQFKTAKWGYAGVPEAEFVKLKRVPYAYRIFISNIKGKYPATKLE
jgi:hypothetical protein